MELQPFTECEFLGYDVLTTEATLMKYRTVKAKNKEFIQLVFDRTPFYGEMGGEVGDTGTITAPDGTVIRILNTVKENNLTIHIAERIPDTTEGTFVLAVVGIGIFWRIHRLLIIVCYLVWVYWWKKRRGLGFDIFVG